MALALAAALDPAIISHLQSHFLRQQISLVVNTPKKLLQQVIKP
jgi:hypothetical protein